MRSTTANYDSKIGVQNELRELDAKVIYRQVDPTAKPDCTATANDIHSRSDADYSIDGDAVPQYNYSSFEEDRWLLDGSFAFTGETTLLTDIPSIGNTLSNNSDNEYTTDLALTFQFTSDHSSSGFSVIFDDLNGEYAEEFDIQYYDSVPALIQTVNVTGNTDTVHINTTAVNNYRKIVLTIKKWSKPIRLARVTEVYFGQIREYTKLNEQLINLKINESVNLTSSIIRGNDMNFTIDNTSDEYDPINPDGIYSYAVARQELETYIGLKISGGTYEYIKTGLFYLTDLKANPNQVTATINANGLLYFMSLAKYNKGLLQNISMYDLAEDILQDFGLTSSQYEIDSALSSISMTCYLPILTYKECLQAIAIASQAILYEDRNGKVILKQISKVASGYDIIKENMFNVPDIQTDKALKAVNVNVYTDTVAAGSTTVGKATLNLNGTFDVEVYYDSPSSNVSGAVSLGAINSATYYTNYCTLNITSTGSTTITLTGKVITSTSSPQSYTTGNIDGETIDIAVPIITDNDVADDIGTWIKAEKDYINNLNVNWRQNMAYELGDVIDDVETKFNNQTNAVIVENNFVFNGALTGNTKLKGE